MATAVQESVCWHYREIRFDVPPSGIALHRGEKMIDSINSVEDTKGNNGDRGSLEITNLRIIWTSHKNPRTNLSECSRIAICHRRGDNKHRCLPVCALLRLGRHWIQLRGKHEHQASGL